MKKELYKKHCIDRLSNNIDNEIILTFFLLINGSRKFSGD